MTNIFTYLSFRAFLKDAFEYLKANRRGFSHRSFAKTAGFSSSNYIMLVIQGKRNLSSDGIQKIAKALKLKKGETEFFENLVRFDQATSDTEKNFYYSKIAANKKYAEARTLEKGEYEYYSKWYVPAIREMILLKNFKEDPEWIASTLTPQITPKEAEAALKLLFDLNMISKSGNGRVEQASKHIFSGDEVASLAIANYHREMIAKAASSIEAVDPGLREIGAITFAVSKEKLAEAKKMIREFRSRLSGFLAEEESGDAVYQFNFQLFNTTKIDEEKNDK